MTDNPETVRILAEHLRDHKGQNVVMMDLRKLNLWTDWFVIATASSSTHMKGLLRHLDEKLAELGVEIARKPKPADDDEWCLLDTGNCVFHLMSSKLRDFYELEKLWFEAEFTKIPD